LNQISRVTRTNSLSTETESANPEVDLAANLAAQNAVDVAAAVTVHASDEEATKIVVTEIVVAVAVENDASVNAGTETETGSEREKESGRVNDEGMMTDAGTSGTEIVEDPLSLLKKARKPSTRERSAQCMCGSCLELSLRVSSWTSLRSSTSRCYLFYFSLLCTKTVS
jgi:hypothetical protein